MTMLLPQDENKTTVHYDPQILGRLHDDVIVLRKVNVKKLSVRATPDANTPWELVGQGQIQLHVREDKLPWYAQGYVVNDQPRDEKVSRDIARATIGFAVARTDTGEILQEFGIANGDVQSALAEATRVSKSAKLVLTPSVRSIVPEVIQEEDDALVQKFLADAQARESRIEASQES